MGGASVKLMRGVAGALAITMASVLTACSGPSTQTATSSAASPAPVAPAAAHGVELPSGQIPWDKVGPGWVLATWSPAPSMEPGQSPPPGPPMAAPTTLYLV